MSSKLTDGLRGLTRTAGFRLTVWYSSVFTAGCLLCFGLAYFLLASSLAKRDHEAIDSKLWDLAGVYQEDGVEGLERAMAAQEHQRVVRPFFVQFRAPGDAQARRFLRGQWSEFDLSFLDALGGDKVEHWVTAPSRLDASTLEVVSLKLSDGLLLQVGQVDDERRELLGGFRSIVAWIVAAAVLISVPGGFLLSRRAMRPVRELIATIKRIEAGAVGARVPARRSRDELDELGRLFNGMLARIETLIAGMKDALDNVAHDLRTPLTRLRAGAEEALVADADAQACREALADCVEEADRVVGMIETLMDVSEAETGLMRLRLEEVDLAAILHESAELYRYAAEDKGVALELGPGGPVRVTADRNRMRQVVANLLDNAVKYTPRGGRVTLEAGLDGAEAWLTVWDTGAGIRSQEIPKVWDRLYRGDASRSQRGLGLGLSLVKAVVLAHKGRVELQSEPSRGARFSLYLPAQAA